MGFFPGCADTGRIEANSVEVFDIRHRIQADTLHYLTGKARNVSTVTQEFQIRVDWLDENGALLGESNSQISAEIGPDQVRAWDTTYYDSNEHGEPDDYEIDVHIY